MSRSRTLLVAALVATSACRDGASPPDALEVVALGQSTLAVGGSVQLQVQGSGAGGEAVTWTSSDTSRVRVDAQGMAVARFPGRAVVTARATHALGTIELAVAPVDLEVLGLGAVRERWTAEVSVRGRYAYTTTWGTRTVSGIGNPGNAIKVWDVAGATPVLVDSVIVTDDAPAVGARPLGASLVEQTVTTLGDVQVSDDGRLLVVATERFPGAILVFSLDDPARPRLLARHRTKNTASGVHTAEVSRVNGRLYAFLSIDPPARDTLPGPQLVIVDLGTPSAPVEVLARPMGMPTVHDVFVRDGVLFTAEWNAGVRLWDVGGTRGGSPANPVQFAQVPIPGGAAHNAYWVHDSTTGEKRWLIVGQEHGAFDPASSAGDVHVIDLATITAPRVVGVYHLDGAGTHNFSVDERAGVLYAAYYNGGVRVLDVRGDLSACTAAQRLPDGRCDLGRMGREVARFTSPELLYIWGVQRVGDVVYASDMLNGLWKLDASRVRR